MAVMPPPRSRGRRREQVPDAIFVEERGAAWPAPTWDAPGTASAPAAPRPPLSIVSTLPPPPPPAVVDLTTVSGAASVFVTEPTTEVPAVDLRAEPSSPHVGAPTPGTLIAQNVSAWFGSRQVLDRCTLHMPAGQVTAIIGPSGCGKSVFLRNLNRMHEVIPTAKMGGLITLDGTDIHSDEMSPTEVRLRIGMVFQRPNPFPSMSIRENVLAGLKLAGKRTKDADALVEWALRRGGLWNEVKDRLDASGAALSGGQQQRLCIARSLAVRPRVLLMDEPCSALDPISTRVIEETILEIGREITIVIVTHNMQQAQRVADQCAFFMIAEQGSPGRVIEAGPTTDIFGNPQDQRTADYVSGRFG